jgi:hypothetical protein
VPPELRISDSCWVQRGWGAAQGFQIRERVWTSQGSTPHAWLCCHLYLGWCPALLHWAVWLTPRLQHEGWSVVLPTWLRAPQGCAPAGAWAHGCGAHEDCRPLGTHGLQMAAHAAEVAEHSPHMNYRCL